MPMFSAPSGSSFRLFSMFVSVLVDLSSREHPLRVYAVVYEVAADALCLADALVVPPARRTRCETVSGFAMRYSAAASIPLREARRSAPCR